jgi:hypothetical protein
MSMRETENEINLLIPGAGLLTPVLGQPTWSFATPAAGEDEDAAGADDVPEADELGEAGNQMCVDAANGPSVRCRYVHRRPSRISARRSRVRTSGRGSSTRMLAFSAASMR